MQKKSVLNSTILVTVQGARKTLDLELPGDVPVSELLPFLLERCDSWEKPSSKGLQSPRSLQLAGAPTPLVPDRTLVEAGICNGDVLVLQIATPNTSLAPQRFVPRSVQPTADTAGIGIIWESLE